MEVREKPLFDIRGDDVRIEGLQFDFTSGATAAEQTPVDILINTEGVRDITVSNLRQPVSSKHTASGWMRRRPHSSSRARHQRLIFTTGAMTREGCALSCQIVFVAGTASFIQSTVCAPPVWLFGS